MSIIKTTWNFLVELADGWTRARVAAELTRQGRHEEAKRIINPAND